MLENADQLHRVAVWEHQDQQGQQDVLDFKVPLVKVDLKALLVMQALQERMHNTVRVRIAVVRHLVLVLHLVLVRLLLQMSANNNIHHKIRIDVVDIQENLFETEKCKRNGFP
jgi:hypothetical protein